jgi:hypothetical protein
MATTGSSRPSTSILARPKGSRGGVSSTVWTGKRQAGILYEQEAQQRVPKRSGGAAQHGREKQQKPLRPTTSKGSLFALGEQEQQGATNDWSNLTMSDQEEGLEGSFLDEEEPDDEEIEIFTPGAAQHGGSSSCSSAEKKAPRRQQQQVRKPSGAQVAGGMLGEISTLLSESMREDKEMRVAQVFLFLHCHVFLRLRSRADIQR